MSRKSPLVARRESGTAVEPSDDLEVEVELGSAGLRQEDR